MKKKVNFPRKCRNSSNGPHLCGKNQWFLRDGTLVVFLSKQKCGHVARIGTHCRSFRAEPARYAYWLGPNRPATRLKDFLFSEGCRVYLHLDEVPTAECIGCSATKQCSHAPVTASSVIAVLGNEIHDVQVECLLATEGPWLAAVASCFIPHAQLPAWFTHFIPILCVLESLKSLVFHWRLRFLPLWLPWYSLWWITDKEPVLCSAQGTQILEA